MKLLYTTSILLIFLFGSCRKYLDVPLPVSSVASDGAFSTDQTCAGALNSVYANFLSTGLFDGTAATSYTLGLYSDELKYYGTLVNSLALYKNAITATAGGATAFWTSFYTQLYSLNQAIAGIQGNNGLTYKSQWLGEAYFTRALIYFYLTNLYGDVPLVTTPDYLINNGLKRSGKMDVYKQVIADLKQAQGFLDDQYHDDGGAVTSGKGRPNRMAATALLARVYLYTADWANAEIQATNVIASAVYQLPAPNKVFLLNSPEIIWGLTPMGGVIYPYQVKDAVVFPIPTGTQPGLSNTYAVTLSDSLKNTFETGDLRYSNWVGADTVAANGSNPQAIYYYTRKYQAKGSFTSPLESLVMFRLGEQYLIRAEARAMQNKLTGQDGAASDLNVIRSRAGLAATAASSQSDILVAIQRERRVELFCEQGHRFFDLRRTGTLDALMTKLVPLKGGAGWNSTQAYWPIPVSDIQNDPNLTQTPGY